MFKKRLVAAWVRAEVWERDEGRCTFLTDGERCRRMEDLVVQPLDATVPPGEADPCAYSLFCHPHAALWALDVPEEDWAHA